MRAGVLKPGVFTVFEKINQECEGEEKGGRGRASGDGVYTAQEEKDNGEGRNGLRNFNGRKGRFRLRWRLASSRTKRLGEVVRKCMYH